ncbi:hypothetical protein [Agromyces sp. C10]|uniref:hypothetical protein n=1 Tax=Agromyces sp. C10 TaxID=2935077 RepID=UPI00200A234D|nr:hypothetical protein [Agromyces sp. C10]MCK8609221.1 hypothetical protein [Agromyces sp. C10]
MRVIRIIVDGREYVLPADQDVAGIMTRITDQVRAGGGFVELVDAPGRTLSVLVSPGMSLAIEVRASEDALRGSDLAADPVEPSWFDPFDLT